MERFSIEERAWITFAIALGAIFLAQLLGAIIGIYSAKRKIKKENEKSNISRSSTEDR